MVFRHLLNQVLSTKLHACLSELEPCLLDSIPECLTDSFTVDALPESTPRFEPDCTDLRRYCIALITVLRDLLSELAGYFVEKMLAPRWVKGEGAIDRNQYA